jgi:hypothetical protein
MPGARSLKMVVAMATAAPSAAISVKLIIWLKMSLRLPAPYAGPEIGTYENHPLSAPVFTRSEPNTRRPPKTKM